MKLSVRLLLLTGSVLALAGCATYPGYYQTPVYGQPSETGTVQQVQILPQYGCGYRSESHTGAVLGAIVGGILGNQLGHGRGRVATTVGGAVAGGFAGQAIQDHRDGNRGYCGDAEQVTIRLDNGQVVVLRQAGRDLYPGERVWVSGNGAVMRAEGIR